MQSSPQIERSNSFVPNAPSASAPESSLRTGQDRRDGKEDENDGQRNEDPMH